MKQSNYYIIAGTNKAATTSFFEYLAAHPGVCPAYIKQTFFFLDKEWQQAWGMKSIYHYDKGLDQYDLFFRDCQPGQHKLEATPDYIYAENTPKRLARFLANRPGKIIFILREPVSRFISLFHFGKQQGILPDEMNFRSFRETSEMYEGVENPSLMAFRTGFYSRYIERYLYYFDRDQIKVYFFEDLKKDPLQFLKGVANDLQLNPDFYDQYNFENHNTTVTVKSRLLEDGYIKMRDTLLHTVYKYPIAYKPIMGLRNVITPLYKKLNSKELVKDAIDPQELDYLQQAYAGEAQRLHRLIDIPVGWDLETSQMKK